MIDLLLYVQNQYTRESAKGSRPVIAKKNPSSAFCTDEIIIQNNNIVEAELSSTIVSCVVAARLSIVCSPKNSLTNILFYPLLCTHGHGHTRTIIIMIRPNTMEDVEVINFQQPPPQDEESTMDVDVDGGSVEAASANKTRSSSKYLLGGIGLGSAALAAVIIGLVSANVAKSAAIAQMQSNMMTMEPDAMKAPKAKATKAPKAKATKAPKASKGPKSATTPSCGDMVGMHVAADHLECTIIKETVCPKDGHSGTCCFEADMTWADMKFSAAALMVDTVFSFQAVLDYDRAVAGVIDLDLMWVYAAESTDALITRYAAGPVLEVK
jgi:hypothetical protein